MEKAEQLGANTKIDGHAEFAEHRLERKGFEGFEPFVDAATVAMFLSVRRAEVLQLTRAGKIRGYPYKGRQRHVYRYRLSEVNADFTALCTAPRSTIAAAAPVSRRRKPNG